MSSFNDPGTGLRQRNKLKRRDAILDAALSILDVDPAESLTVDRVALLAELSPATVYNLVGGRDEVLRALAVRIVERTGSELIAHAEAGHPRVDALWMSRLTIDLGSTLLVERPAALRRLISYLGSLGTSALLLTGSDGTPLDAPDPHISTMRHAQKKGMIRRNLDPVVLGTLVANAYNGALLRWSYGGIDDTRLAPFCRLGLISVAASACTAPHRAGLEREMATLSRETA
jgi:AcrR family transcriptional regulator